MIKSDNQGILQLTNKMFAPLFGACLLVIFPLNLWASFSDTNFDGEANLGFDLSSKPSSKEGESAFVLRKIQLESETSIDEKATLNLRVTGFDERATSTKKFLLLLEQANINFFSNSDTISLGLVKHPWLVRQDDYYDYELWGTASRLISSRFLYVAQADQGVVWRRFTVADSQIQVALLNGEENRSDERGPKKESVVAWDQSFGEGFVGLAFVYGTYEDYSPASEKIRFLGRFRYPWGRSQFGIEVLYARDPADAVTQLGLAEGVQLSAELPGQKTTARGASLWWGYVLDESSQVFAKIDSLNPSLEVADKALFGGQLGYVSQWSKSIQLVFFYDQLQKQSKHSNTSLQSEKIGFSTQINF